MTETAAAASSPTTGPIATTGAVATTLSSRERTAIILLLVGTFVCFLNEMTMGVALPQIMDDLDVTPSVGQWLTTAFALTTAVVIPITGWLMQRVATRPIFVGAMTLFTLGTLLAAVAPAFELLVVARVVQASGTAVMMPLMMTTMLTIVPIHMRGQIMGRMSIVMSVAPALGPSIAGLLLQLGSWRAIFWAMLPLAIIVLVIGFLRVPNVSELTKVPLDVLSVILSAVAFGSLVYGLSSLGTAAEGVSPIPPWAPVALGVVTLALFVWRQLVLQRNDAALLDLRTFRYPMFTISLAVLAVGMVALFGMSLMMPIFMMRGLGISELAAGLALLPGGILMGVLGPLVGRLYDRVGPLPLALPGSILVSAVYWFMTTANEGMPYGVLVAANMGLSLGLAFMFTPLFGAGLGSLPQRLYSHGSATVATLQQVGGAAGTALFAAFYSIGVLAAGAEDPITAAPHEVAAGVRLAFLVGAIATVGVVILSAFVRRPPEVVPDLPVAQPETAAA